jgi:tetratricopeptide (TPR) repeat protein
MVSLATQHPEAAVYYCSAQGMDVEGRDLPQVFGGPVRPPDAMYGILLRANFLVPSTIVMRHSVIVAAGLFDQELRSCEDWDLWLRILPKHTFVGTSACLVRYRLHGGSLSTNPAGMQQATRAVIEKHFGPDDGQWQTWSEQKQRAYGGVYRYHVLTSVQRQGDWQAATQYLRQALQADPTLATDLDFFYDLALGSQSSGYRGTSYELSLEDNASHISQILANVFVSSTRSDLEPLRRQTYGTAFFALGLVAYNTRQLPLSRRFLLQALRFRPEGWRDRRVIGNLMKSLFGRSVLAKLRRDREQAGSQ